MSNEHEVPTVNPPVIAGLEVLGSVARGGHGTVYRARQRDHDRVVALKVLDGRNVDDATRRRFDRERVALGRLSDHPSIVAMFDSGFTDAGYPYLLLEYAPGGSLADRLASSGPLSLDETTRLGVCLAGALERSHRAGVIHRDIKPANVMLSAYGEWLLTDFGIASLIDGSPTAVIHATLAHMAPEALQGKAPQPSADVYSLASLLATCLTGAQPFDARADEAPISVMRRIAADAYPDLESQGVPGDLATVLAAALSKEPSERPGSAEAFGKALNHVRVAHGLRAVPVRTGGSETPETIVVGPESQFGSVSITDEISVSSHSRSGVSMAVVAMITVALASMLALFQFNPLMSVDNVAVADEALTDASVPAVVDDEVETTGADDLVDGVLRGERAVIDVDDPVDLLSEVEAAPDPGEAPDDDAVAFTEDIADEDDGPGGGGGDGGNGPGGGGGDGGNGPGGGGGGGGNGPGGGGGGGGGNGPGGGGGGGGGNGPGGGGDGGGG